MSTGNERRRCRRRLVTPQRENSGKDSEIQVFRWKRSVMWTKGGIILCVLLALFTALMVYNTSEPGDLAKAILSGASILAASLACLSLLVVHRNKQVAEGSATVAAWSTAQSRLGTLYDMAINDAELRTVLNEPESYEPPQRRSAKQQQWASNVLIALEQATAAAARMEPESQQVWARYISNRAKMPTFRALMLESEVANQRSSETEWRCDRRLAALVMRALATFQGFEPSDDLRRRLMEIDEAIFSSHIFSDDWLCKPKTHFRELLERAYACWKFPDDTSAPVHQSKFIYDSESGMLTAELLTLQDKTHEPALRSLYLAHGQQLLPLPLEWTDVVAGGDRYALLLDGQLIGMFRVYECFGQATMAVLLDPERRRSRIGTRVALWAAEIARSSGWTFVYLDVYEGNLEAEGIMKSAGLRRFHWYGAPLAEVEAALSARGSVSPDSRMGAGHQTERSSSG